MSRHRGVRRQGFWHQDRAEVREYSAHQVGWIIQRAGGVASGALRASLA